MSIVRYALATVFAWLLVAPANAQEAQQQCKVLDPELQLSYEGDCVNGAAFGTGLARGQDGAWYEGQFMAGAKTGQGKKHYPTGDVYTGQWKRDKRHGYGEYEFGEGSPWRGDRYEGYWQDDLRHGTGTYIFYPSNDRFEAHWKNGGTDSQGTTTLARRKWAYQAVAVQLSKPGTQVCSTTVDGASPKNILKGTIAEAMDDRIKVSIQNRLDSNKINNRWHAITDWSRCIID